MNKNSYKKMVIAAMFAAIICVGTMILHIPVSFAEGYVHLGDAFILLAAGLLGFPYAFAAASIGAALADLLSGYAVYAIPTFIIKSAMIILFVSKGKIISKRNLLACVAYIIITIVGYYITAGILYGFAGAFGSVYDNIIQTIGSIIVFVIIGTVIDKTGLKDKLM